MSAEWYYTTNKQQMGPVSWKELRELAEVGILKPHDMVWSEGMDEWIKAINQSGLFADGEEAVSASPAGKKKSSYSEPKPPPGRRTRRRDDEAEEEEEEDERTSKRKARKREEDRAKRGIGLRVALGIGAVVGLLLLGTCVCGGLAYFTWGGGGGGLGGGAKGFTARNLAPQQSTEQRFTLTEGKRVIITSTNTLGFPNTDVDLYVFRGNAGGPGQQPFAMDERIPPQFPHCRVEFIVPATDTYRVVVLNRGPGFANSCVVSVNER